jgi:hypothetical protein
MKSWEIIADNLTRDGWTWGYCSYFVKGRKKYMVDARREGYGRFIIHADDILTAFDELETQCRAAAEVKSGGLF